MHIHSIEEYKSDIYKIKKKWKKIAAQILRGILLQIFDEETRMHPFACEISFNECESAVYKEEETNLKLFSLLRNCNMCQNENSHLITNLHFHSVTKRQ